MPPGDSQEAEGGGHVAGAVSPSPSLLSPPFSSREPLLAVLQIRGGKRPKEEPWTAARDGVSGRQSHRPRPEHGGAKFLECFRCEIFSRLTSPNACAASLCCFVPDHRHLCGARQRRRRHWDSDLLRVPDRQRGEFRN